MNNYAKRRHGTRKKHNGWRYGGDSDKIRASIMIVVSLTTAFAVFGLVFGIAVGLLYFEMPQNIQTGSGFVAQYLSLLLFIPLLVGIEKGMVVFAGVSGAVYMILGMILAQFYHGILQRRQQRKFW